MAISQLAQDLITRIDIITEKLSGPVLPSLFSNAGNKNFGSKHVTFLEAPKITGSSFPAPSTPFLTLYSKAPASSGTRLLCTEENPKSTARCLLLKIKAKIHDNDDKYLRGGNEELEQDIEEINKMLTLKFATFKELVLDFIDLVSELNDVLNMEPSVIFERHFELKKRTQGQLPERRAAKEQAIVQAQESESSCLDVFAKCRAFYCS